MPLVKDLPRPSSRMGMCWTLGTIENLAILEFGQMGHSVYHKKFMEIEGANIKGVFYSTHIDEKDIALGLEDKVYKTIKEIETNDYIQAIALIPSSTGEVIGTDYNAIVDEIISEEMTKLPFFTVSMGSTKFTEKDGASESLYEITKNLTKDYSSDETINIIGAVTKISNIKLIEEIKLKNNVRTILSYTTSVKEITKLTKATKNIVINDVGLKTAEYLKNTFNMPYSVV
ncbi:MAG: nitrogenase component 1 [Lachnospirales bacterium]